MKKKTTLCLTGFILVFIIVGVFMFTWNRNKEVPAPSQNGTLIINNGAEITENVVIHFIENASYADLPFTEVMRGLGITVDWIDSDVAAIAYNDEKYI